MARILVEGIDAFIVVCSVVIVWMIGLYYNVFWIEIQDILWYEEKWVAIVASYEHAIAQSKPFDLQWTTLPSSDVLFEDLTIIESLPELSTQQLYEYNLDEYLENSLSSYALPFSTIPPGRFMNIPSIGVQAPIVDVPFATPEKIENAEFTEELRQWVVQYPHMSNPGESWNTMIFGHSSVDMLQASKEDFGYIFYKLPKLTQWDIIEVVWDGELLEYEVTEKMIKRPKDVPDEVNKKVDYDMLTLMACYPLMSDAQRILVKALPREVIAAKKQQELLTFSSDKAVQ